MVEVFPAEARKSRDEFSSRKEVHGYGWLRRVYTRGGVSPSGHEWSLQDFYIEGGERRRSVSMRQVCMGIREGGREEERFARKFVTLGWNILEGQVLKFREVRLGYGLETVC